MDEQGRRQKFVSVVQFRQPGGKEPVREWLLSLGRKDRQVVGRALQTLEFGWPVGMPLCRAVKSHKGLWELRSTLSGGRNARIFFAVSGHRLVLLHGFIKKSQKTPKQELNLAVQRMNEGEQR